MLFRSVYEDLARRVREPVSEYDLLGAAALLRQLLLDGNPLMHQVNRERRLPLRFEVNNNRPEFPPDLPQPDVHLILDGIAPTLATVTAGTVEVKLDGFLAWPLMLINGEAVDVHRLIDHVAHVLGAVHAGEPASATDRALAEAAGSVVRDLVGGNIAIRGLRGIGEVTLAGLRPLYEAVVRG